MAWLRLTPFAEFVERRRPGYPLAEGVYHRLTGFSFALQPQLKNMLAALRDTSIAERDLRSAPPEARHTFQILRDAHILVTGTDCDGLLRPFLEWRITKPAMNPALAWLNQQGEYKLTRLPEMNVCRFPRSSSPPQPLTEDLPEHAWRLMGMAEQGKSLLAAMRAFPPGEVGIAPRSKLWQALMFLTDPRRQMIRFAAPDVAPAPARHPVHYLNQSFHYAQGRETAPVSSASGREFYDQEITDAEWNFDWVEPTICHAFRFPSEAFDLQTYGERFCDAAAALAGLKCGNGSIRILEIGGGTGSLACGFLKRARERFSPAGVDYTIVDCSKTLMEKQKASLREAGQAARHILQSAEELSIPGEHFDLVISNEMIADLTVASGGAGGEQEGDGWVHTGVYSLIDRLRTHVSPGASVILTEYGEKGSSGSLQDHLNHHECSIDFDAVAGYARQSGFDVQVLEKAGFLQPRNETEMLCGGQDHLACLNMAVARKERRIPFAAYSRPRFETLCGELESEAEIRGAGFAPMREGLHYGPDLAQFHVVHLKMPEAGSR